jgi:isopenicillin N synthase-like dioxygenase
VPVIYSPPIIAPIPFLDLDPAGDPDALAAELRAAAVDTGFWYIKNHGVDPRIVDDAFAAVRRFFDLPLEAKERVPRTPTTKGYEGNEKHYTDPGSAPDVKESWNCGWDRGPATPAFAANKWPAELPDPLFKDTIETYYRAVDAVAARLIPVIARSLGLPDDFFAEAFRYPGTSLRVLTYPPHPEQPKFNQLGAGAHTDGGIITILAQDDCGGLEILNPKGDWIAAQVIPQTFVVNIGDTLARWTNDLYRSSLHRVKNNAGRTRNSMAFFYSPTYYTEIACLPQCLAPGETPKYEPVISGEYSAYRLKRARK